MYGSITEGKKRSRAYVPLALHCPYEGKLAYVRYARTARESDGIRPACVRASTSAVQLLRPADRHNSAQFTVSDYGANYCANIWRRVWHPNLAALTDRLAAGFSPDLPRKQPTLSR